KTPFAIVVLGTVAAMTVGLYTAIQEAQAFGFSQSIRQSTSCHSLIVFRAGCGNADAENNFDIDFGGG
ncbi:MAG: hypothetical protein ACJ71R_22130, partial [Nitrososphaeraceae archaeon]